MLLVQLSLWCDSSKFSRLFCGVVVGVCPPSYVESLHRTDCKSFKWDICARCHISIQQISRSIWSVRSDNSFRRSRHKLPTKSVITQLVLREPLRWLMNWEMENWFGWVGRVGYEASVAMGFFFPTFCLFIVPSLNTVTLIMWKCRGITHVKEANLINFLFYVLCLLPLCARLLWKDGSFAKHAKSHGKICFIFI